MNRESWAKTVAMNHRQKELETWAKALADRQIEKSKLRRTLRTAMKDPTLAEAARIKAWLAADRDNVHCYTDASAPDGYRWELPEGWPVGTDPREAEYTIKSWLVRDEDERTQYAWVFEGDDD